MRPDEQSAPVGPRRLTRPALAASRAWAILLCLSLLATISSGADSSPVDAAGFLTDNANGKRELNPRFHGVPGQIAVASQTYVAAPGRTADGKNAWDDPSPHRTSFVTLEDGVQLEMLDWGGTGRALVLLAASGWTAHVFDDFAPKLTGRCHVYGITRRGFGASGFVAGKSGIDLLGDDVLAVITGLKLDRPVLAGHSFAGGELSSIATRYPARIAGAIYLDAAYPVAFDNGRGMSPAEFQEIVRSPPVPHPEAVDLASFAALQRYYQRMHGVRFPEAALRQNWAALPDDRLGQRHDFPGSATLMLGTRKFSSIPVPALVIFANPQRLGPWLEDQRDPLVQEAVRSFSTKFAAYARKQAVALQEAVPTARVVTFPGANHFVFISHEAEVVREITGFIASLP